MTMHQIGGNQQVQTDRTIPMKKSDTIIRRRRRRRRRRRHHHHHHHHHLPPWIRSFDLFRHRLYRLCRRELYVPGRDSQAG